MFNLKEIKKIRVLGIIATLFFATAIWYLFIKKYDYQMAFSANAAPGGIYHKIKEIESWGSDKKRNTTLLDTTLFRSVTQKIDRNDNSFVLDWKLRRVSDTVTRITVGIISKKHSVRNRLKVLLGSSTFIENIKKEMIQYGKEIFFFTNSFKVNIEGEDLIPQMEYVYIPLQSRRREKANAMIRGNGYLYPKLKKNNLKEIGYPFVKIKEWNTQTDTIQFDFGFSGDYKDLLIEDSEMQYGKLVEQRALKATFYGNYKNSDQAWFCLLEYAEKYKIPVKKTFLEIFYDNPMEGGDELQWKAEIFIPIDDQQ
ncbi:hypothetical protein [Aquimarina sp. 2201CG5-10]|uniref:hypothetical protein n=1 Tax=Aquimarina callyspongiae TaxID=3098150 RepID=UPI002AB36B80|nr:hypothetical protein [Aquimarina sp. 2201CG5-10]MDY8134743.1 hypothetical protein [Aquimarina sp. 2201CG5-10]